MPYLIVEKVFIYPRWSRIETVAHHLTLGYSARASRMFAAITVMFHEKVCAMLAVQCCD
jgi:hypothetical protein